MANIEQLLSLVRGGSSTKGQMERDAMADSLLQSLGPMGAIQALNAAGTGSVVPGVKPVMLDPTAFAGGMGRAAAPGVRGLFKRGAGPVDMARIGMPNPLNFRAMPDLEKGLVSTRNQMSAAARNMGWEDFKNMFTSTKGMDKANQILLGIDSDDALKAFYETFKGGR